MGRASRSLVVLSAVLAVSACGAGSTDADEGTGAAPTTDAPGAGALVPAAEGDVDYPLTVETAWGEVTLEQRPERVVAGSWRGELSWLLALGVTPVAVDGDESTLDLVPWAEDMLAQPIEQYWSTDELALEPEAIAAAEPDLIAAASLGSEPVPNLGQLESVAPVLAQATQASVVPWQENILELGTALDLQGRAQQVIDDYDTFFEDFRNEHTDFAGRTVAYLEFFGGDELYFGNPAGSAVDDFFGRMGFDSNTSGLSDAEPVSRELLAQVEGDVLMVVDYTDDDGTGEFQRLVDSPLFQAIPAVRDDRAIYLSNPDRTTLYQDGVEIGPVAHPSVAYDDPIGSPLFAELLAPVLEAPLSD